MFRPELESITDCDGKFEIIPDVLWQNFKKAINGCLQSSRLNANQVSCLGISSQRGTFLTWDRQTGRPLHNFISWKDKRSQKMCNKWNSSFLFKFLQLAAFFIFLFTQFKKFQVYSKIKFSPTMVLPRLYFIFKQIPKILDRCAQERVLFGTMDTWLLWKLTGGRTHATDGSNACVTGFFDPFEMKWSWMILKIFNIPRNILPEVKNTSDSFGHTLSAIFGSSIPVCCVVGDQQASMFGARCFQKYDVNCSMGTGSFLTVNTGDSLSYSYSGFFPLVGWTINSRTTYVAECGVHNTGPAVTWMQRLGFFQDPCESSVLAESVEDTGGVFFLPTVHPLKVCEEGKFRFENLNIGCSKGEIVRSILESIAFQVALLFGLVQTLYGKNVNVIRMCGGVSKNDFVAQYLSDITSQRFERLNLETASLGAAFLAGLHRGFWNSMEDFKEIKMESDVFIPHKYVSTRLNSFHTWKKLLDLNYVR